MIFKNRDGQCYFVFFAFFFRFLRDHANEDHVWTKNIGKPKENQWFLKIAHERKWSSPKKAFFSEVPGAQKCCKKHYEIKIFVVRDQKMTWEIMKMKIMYEQKTWENPRKTNDFKNRSREKVKKSKKDSFSRGAHGSKCFKKQYEIIIFVVSHWPGPNFMESPPC